MSALTCFYTLMQNQIPEYKGLGTRGMAQQLGMNTPLQRILFCFPVPMSGTQRHIHMQAIENNKYSEI